MIGLLIVAIIIFAIVQKRRYGRVEWSRSYKWMGWDHSDKWRRSTDQAERYARDFERKMADKFDYKAEKFQRKLKAKIERDARRYGFDPAETVKTDQPVFKTDAERQAYERARKRAAAEAGFYVHLMWYGMVIGFLFLINLLTTSYPWFLWPALGWGFGLASHFSAVFGWRWVHDRVFEPAIQREVQREVMQEKEVLRTEKQASLDELTATFAHEIRNPIAAAKSLVQQMGEDPTSHENVEYAKVALDELARVERSVSHLLKYAKEEDYKFENVNLAMVLDGALTQMRSKLEAKSVSVSRNYLSGPTVRADADKLRQVFSNMIDNAIDAMEGVASDRRIELAIINARSGMATVRIRDNGCGIAADKVSKIFNPFYTSKDNGTGLGLGVAKKVIDAHRGTIEVNSQAGAGTEFAVSVPLSDAVRDSRVQEPPVGPEIQDQPAADLADVSDRQSPPAATGTQPLSKGTMEFARGRQ
ncbi:MAG TPA: HAMP domain-containing sensor histidine kinase [Candidatus Binataceae bacterium]